MKVAIPLILATIAMSIQASAETLPTSTSTAPSTDMSSAAWSACSRFQPGHYVFISDDKSRNVDGLKSLQNFLSKDVSSFKGVHYEVTWGSIEKSPGVYDFSRIDAALAQVKAKKKYLQMFFRDRTFHTGCNSNFVPSYVNKEGSYASSSACYAKIWEKTTMDHMIRVLKQVALRYKDDPNILGITLAETSVGALSMKGHPEVRRALDAQLKRVYPAVHSVAPSLIVHQMMNWGTDDSIYALTNDLAGIGGGGAMGWPDTVPSKVNEWHWYRTRSRVQQEGGSNTSRANGLHRLIALSDRSDLHFSRQ